MKPAIVIVGSLNMDFVVQHGASAFGRGNGTGERLSDDPGRKGANQACAAGRLASGVLSGWSDASGMTFLAIN